MLFHADGQATARTCTINFAPSGKNKADSQAAEPTGPASQAANAPESAPPVPPAAPQKAQPEAPAPEAASAAPAASPYPPLVPNASGKPLVAAHLAGLEGKTARLTLQALAPGKVLTGVRIDNIGGIAAKWRSDGLEDAAPLVVKDGQTTLAEGIKPVAVPMGEGERLLTLEFTDNGAVADAGTKLRITLFFQDKERALCALSK
jgi:hypothetical protein